MSPSEDDVHFTCAKCGETHDASEIAFGADAPDPWLTLTPEQRERSLLSSDQCVIETSDTRAFYIRACLEIPIQGTERHFEWGVWCSLSERSFEEVSANWTNPDRVSLGPYFGWLSTTLPFYPETMSMKTMVHSRAVGVRPYVELEPTDHPLAVEQREGITPERVRTIVERLLHTRERA